MNFNAEVMQLITAIGIVAILVLKLAEMCIILLVVTKAIQTMNYIAELQSEEQ